MAKKAKKKKKKKTGGRPTKYKARYANQAYKLCLLGATDKELGDFFEIEEKTINNWKIEQPKFLQSLKKGKIAADANVAERLYLRACGYEHPDVHISSYEGDITITDITKHYPPDTGACMAWLKNRTRKQVNAWSDNYDHKVTGNLTLSDIAAQMRVNGSNGH